ncbi:MAG: M55 family metallopeptidase [bacterium]
MKIYISTDLEGVAGVVDFDLQTAPESPYYDEARSLLTGEVNAAVEGILETGDHEVVVLDGHGHRGLLYRELHKEAKAILGRPLHYPFAFDGSFDALFIVGQHAMAGTPGGNLHHTQNHKSVVGMWLNGEPIGEIGTFAAVAGYFNVPFVFLSGDSAACREAQRYAEGVITVAVKEGINQGAAICLSHSKACESIRAGAREACGRVREIKPFKVPPPISIKMEFMSINSTYNYQGREGVRITGPTTIEATGDDYLKVLRAVF